MGDLVGLWETWNDELKLGNGFDNAANARRLANRYKCAAASIQTAFRSAIKAGASPAARQKLITSSTNHAVTAPSRLLVRVSLPKRFSVFADDEFYSDRWRLRAILHLFKNLL